MNKPIKATINQSIVDHISTISDGLLTTSTPINQRTVYTFDGLEVYDDIMDTVINNGIHEKIARHCLNRLYSKGNMSAYEILTTGTAIIDFDDISSEVLLALYENKDCLEVADGQFTITDDDAIKAVYGACSRFMYRFMQRHYKHLFTVIDGQEIDIYNTKALASFADFDDIESMSMYQGFLNVVMSVYPKDYARIEKVVKMRIDGMIFTECAKKLGVNPSTITRLQVKISECAKLFLKTL